MNEIPMESKDLLEENNLTNLKPVSNGRLPRNRVANEPPDGGLRAYSIVIASFLTNGLLFGVINSYGDIYEALCSADSTQDGSFKSRAALAGSMAIGTTFLLSSLAGVMTAILGLRLTAVIGGSIAASGLLVSSYFVDHINVLCFTYGFMYGLGASLAYTPSLAILGHYFKRYLGFVNGVVTLGSSIFTVIIPPLNKYIIKEYGLKVVFQILACLTVGVTLCGLIFKPLSVVPIEKPSSEDSRFKVLIKKTLDVQIWKNTKYRLWAMFLPIALFGYFVPYVHFAKFTKEHFPGENQNLPLQCIAIGSGLSRISFGILADRKGVNKIFLQQIAFYFIGVLTIILPFIQHFPIMVAVSLGMGIFDGALVTLIGPIAVHLCGNEKAAQAIGCLLGLASIPISLGPPIADHVYTLMGNSYTLSFVLSGITPIIGASLLFAIRFQKS